MDFNHICLEETSFRILPIMFFVSPNSLPDFYYKYAVQKKRYKKPRVEIAEPGMTLHTNVQVCVRCVRVTVHGK